jgi:hypothetical protein
VLALTPYGHKMHVRSDSAPVKSKNRRHSFTIIGALHEEKKPREKRTNSLTGDDLVQTSFSTPSFAKNAAVLDLSEKKKKTDQFTAFQDGVLCKNLKSFDNVDFCFVCDRRVVIDEWVLKPSIEITGMKFNGSADMIAVYRQIFLCPGCCQEIDARKQYKSLLSGSVIKITQNARDFFT